MTLLRSCWAAGLALATAEVPSLDPATYREPSEAEYWGNDKDARRPFAEERLKSSQLDEAAFRRRILDGKVFVVEDVGQDWPMANWSCEFFGQDPDFAKADLHAYYLDEGAISGNDYVSFNSGWEGLKQPSSSDDPDAPQVAPYYFGIKTVHDEDENNPKTWNKAMLQKVQKHIKLPAFVPKVNQVNFNNTPEFWFSAAGGGAKAHMDPHTYATVSFQITGTKRWRLAFMDERKAPFLATLYDDGGVYGGEQRWQPQFIVTLQPGQALFVPPGFVHETLNLGEECTASVTHQFSVPMAASMYRRFLPRVRMTADIHEAWYFLMQWAALYSKAPKEGQPYGKAKAEAMGSKGVGARFRKLDADGDGQLTEAELRAEIKGLEEEEMDPVGNVLGFHDLNEDGAITREEFAEVYGFWAGTTAAAIAATPKKYRKLQVKASHALETGFSLHDGLGEKLKDDLLELGRRMEAKRELASTEL